MWYNRPGPILLTIGKSLKNLQNLLANIQIFQYLNVLCINGKEKKQVEVYYGRLMALFTKLCKLFHFCLYLL